MMYCRMGNLCIVFDHRNNPCLREVPFCGDGKWPYDGEANSIPSDFGKEAVMVYYNPDITG